MTPLLEKETSIDKEDEEGEEPTHQGRRRTQSLSKTTPTNNQDNSCYDNVFGSHQNERQDIADPVRRLFSSSEDNLLSETQNGRGQQNHASSSSKTFEDGILKLVASDASLSSSIDSGEYKPFQSTNVQALLLPPSHATPTSSNNNEIPARSLPRDFRRTPPSLPPVRQLSEGQIHVARPALKTASFLVGSPPPISSPLSFKSSLSVPSSSRGSFSEGFLEEELSRCGGTDETPPTSNTSTAERVKTNNTDDKSLSNGSKTSTLSVKSNYRISGGSTDEDLPIDIPLPDESPHPSGGGVVKSSRSLIVGSRDSGLSDSPDPFVDFGSSSSHSIISSRVLVDKLTALDKESKAGSTKPHPLINKTTPTRPAPVKRQKTVPHKPRVTKHVMRVMKSLDLDDRAPPILSPPSDGDPLPEERLRMISPDVIFSPSDEEGGVVGGDWSMRRSKSHGESVYSTVKDESLGEQDTRQLRDLIISETKVGRRVSKVSLGFTSGKEFSKSLDDIAS